MSALRGENPARHMVSGDEIGDRTRPPGSCLGFGHKRSLAPTIARFGDFQ